MLGTVSCEEQLDTTPKGSLSDQLFGSAGAVDGLITAAYGSLDTHFQGIPHALHHPPSNWSFGDMRSDDAYKGGGGPGDIINYHQLEVGNITADNGNVEAKWRANYIAIANVNQAIRALLAISEADYPKKAERLAEMRVLRGHFYFDQKKNFYIVPWIDETVEFNDIPNVGIDLSSDQLWTKIEDDFKAGLQLPQIQQEKSRVTEYVARAYLCKAYIFQKKWAEAAAEADVIINSGQFGLLDDFEKVYSLPEYEHAGEFIFSIAHSVRDGSTQGNLNWGDLLNSPVSPAYTSGDNFHRPSQNLVNAFKVDDNGLPLLDSFNETDFQLDDFVDPRLDHAVGRPGIPWKDWTGGLYQESWARARDVYGVYSRKKNIISPNSPLRSSPGFPWALGALDFPLIKYTDVLLWKAEASIELGNLEIARELINQIRQRAATAPVVTKLDGSGPAANYRIGLYPSTGWTKEYATKALRFERRLELCIEGHRMYDLVRWGIAAETINKYFEAEKVKRTYLSSAYFTPDKNEYLPIPQSEIDRSQGVYSQPYNY